MAEKTIYEQALDKLEELKGSILLLAAAEDTERSRLRAEHEVLRKAVAVLAWDGVTPKMARLEKVFGTPNRLDQRVIRLSDTPDTLDAVAGATEMSASAFE